MNNYEQIIYEKKDTISTITLNRPHALNTLTRTMFQEIGSALDDSEQKVSMPDADSRLELAIMYGLVEATSEDKAEGMRAFIEKRKPVGRGDSN